MVGDKVVCERWCVKDGGGKVGCERRCVKDGVSKMVRVKAGCERWCVTKWCERGSVKDGF